MTKRIIYLFSLIMAVCSSALLISCGDDDEPQLPKVEVAPGASAQIDLEANQTIAASAVRFVSTGDWAVEVVAGSRTVSSVDWLDISHSKGPAGDYALTLYSKPNTTTVARQAVVNVMTVGNTLTFRVTQAGQPNGGGEGPLPTPDPEE